MLFRHVSRVELQHQQRERLTKELHSKLDEQHLIMFCRNRQSTAPFCDLGEVPTAVRNHKVTVQFVLFSFHDCKAVLCFVGRVEQQRDPHGVSPFGITGACVVP